MNHAAPTEPSDGASTRSTGVPARDRREGVLERRFDDGIDGRTEAATGKDARGRLWFERDPGAGEREEVAAGRTEDHRCFEHDVGNRPSGRTHRREADPARQHVATDRAHRGLVADEAAQTRGDAYRAAAVGRRRERHQRGRQRGRGSTARTAGRPLGIPGIARRAEDGVGRERGVPERRRVRTTDHDRARVLEPRDHDVVDRVGRGIGEQRGAERGAHAAAAGEVLHQQGKAREDTGARMCACFGARLVGAQRGDSIERRMRRLDATQAFVDQLQRVDALVSDSLSEFAQHERETTTTGAASTAAGGPRGTAIQARSSSRARSTTPCTWAGPRRCRDRPDRSRASN